MKQNYLLLLFAVGLLFGLPSRAQVTKTLNGTVRYESGMSTTTFETPNGDIVMKLPLLISGMITGTVSTEPAGKTEKEKKRNLKELLKFVVMLDGQKIPVSAAPTNFDWLSHQNRQSRTPMQLLNVSGNKVAEVSLPPVLSAPATVNPGNAPRLSTPSNVLLKGDVLNVYTDQQFSPGEKFILTDSKKQHFSMSTVCLSLQQAVMNVPDGASPGNCTVSRQAINQPASNAAVARFTLMSMDLSSPNTNLRPGQQSFVQVLCKGSAGNGFVPITGLEDWYYSFDLRNLDPKIVTMEGGNLQRVYPDDNRYTVINLRNDGLPTNFQIRRNITGVTPGTFSVSATLHEDYNTSNDPFRPQINVLKTPEDFNVWANALKKDLKGYAGMHDNDLLGQVIKTNTQRAIDNMPVCTSPEQLDESKAVAYSLLQPLHVPKGAAISWLSSYEASKVAVHPISNILAGTPDLVDYDVLKNGVEFINRAGAQLKDPSLQTECSSIQQLIDNIQTTSETKENLQNLKDKMNVLTAKAGLKIKADEEIIIKTGMKDIIMSSYQLPSLARPGKVHPVNNLIGFFYPQRKVLIAAPGNEQKVLNEYNAVRLADGHYQVQSVTAYRQPVNMTVSLMYLPPFEIFRMSKRILDSLLVLKTTVDELNEQAVKDSAKKGALVWFELDSINATWSRIFLDSKCVEIAPAKKGDCIKDNRRSKLVFNEKDELVWKYASMRIDYPAVKECLRAKMGQCQEILTYIRKVTLYDGINCNIEISSHTEGLQFVCK